METKKINLVISFVIIVVLIIFGFIGFKYFDNKKVEVKEEKNTPKVVLVESLSPQAGLPILVEAKRQAVYKAAISHDYDKLVGEVDVAVRNSKSSEGPMSGFVYFLNNADQSSKEIAFKTIPALLKTSYEEVYIEGAGVHPTLHYYIWPSAAQKMPDQWTNEEIEELKTFLTDTEIESAREFGYSNYRLRIESDGGWAFLVGD